MSKTVISNIFSNISATLINILAPIITIPLLTSGLGISEYGLYVSLLAKGALFVVLTEFGFGMYLAKAVSINRNDNTEISLLFWIFLVSKLAVFLAILAGFYIFSDEFGIVESLLCAFIFFQLINITPILSGLENYKFLTKVQLVSRTIMVGMISLTSFENMGLEKALLIQVFISALLSIPLFFYFIKYRRLVSVSLNWSKFKEVLKGSFPFYGAKLFVNLYQQSSTYFVSFLLSDELVAMYSISIQLYKVGQSVIGAVARVLYTSTVKTKNFMLIRRLTVRSFLIHLSIFPIVLFYGENILSLIFSFDVSILSDLSTLLYLSLLSVIFSSYWGYPALSAIGKENYAHLGILVASVVYFAAFGILVAFELNSIYLMVGCIIISDVMGMLVRLFFARKFKLI